ncbi:putative cardiolipin-specific deacylase, mitochondrial [Rhypophila decipiens]|uniref:Cardiolipin-specific deacylase, mitochondrial n=1 Tax=Rhypophila decipiens TaxID=261697 RepID=A0AAN6YIB7_9PEZI|nr:putative cardiolipin-specific deacylase, mitochondrial [Rhypophila decipiens]
MLKTFPTAILQLPKRLKFASLLKRRSDPGDSTVQTTQVNHTAMATDDEISVPPGPPTSQLSAPAAKSRRMFFPLGYKEAAYQWWTGVSSRQAERNVLSFVPYLREHGASASQLQDLAKEDPFGQRVWRSSMVQLSGKDRALNELAIERVNEPVDDTLVMLHGYGAGLGFFYKNFEPLSRAQGWKVYALDLLGMGNSARPAFRVKAKTQKEKIAEAESWFIDALEEWRRIRKIEKFTLMGHSLGGYLAVSYALKYPGHLNKLILASPVGIPEDPWAVNEAMPEPSMSRLSNEFTQDQESIVQREGMNTTKPNTAAPPKRPIPGWFSYLWDANVSPFSIVRLTGPLGPRFVSGWTSRRFSHLPPEEKEALHTYSYTLFNSKGSGEYALPYLLAPGAYARSPVINRIQEVGRQILKPATEDSPEVRETGFPIVFMYGENDWMDVAGGFAAEEKINQRVVKALLHGTDEEKRNENGGAKVVVVTKAGHHLYIDNPDEFNRVILKEMEETRKWGLKQKAME